MKETNIISIVQAQENLNPIQCEDYFKYLGINPKSSELNDLKLLISQIEITYSDIKVFDKYYFGYTIPQIGKEFDLLRFGENYTINIELKSKDTGRKIFSQLERNEYYLSFLKEKVYCFTFVSSTNKLYSLSPRGKLIERTINELIQLLSNQEVSAETDLDKLFDPSNYLVSPFNSTLKFIYGEYFLTQQQEIFKKAVHAEMSKKTASFISICGRAGTGKTLLTFDIAKDFIDDDKKVLIIHIGILNKGHFTLINDYGWDIIPIRDLNLLDFPNYDLIILDETQRIRPPQLRAVISTIEKQNNNCIFSYDIKQCLRSWETNNQIDRLIEEETSSKVFKLTEKIRTNKEVASFIKCLFDKKEIIHKLDRSNIKLNFFNNTVDAKRYVKKIETEDWKIINYTPSRKHTHPYDSFKVSSADSTHEVIGQEFDKVVVIIDSFFYYNDDNLSVKHNGDAYFYSPQKMLFQMMTRTRKKLNLVIIGNNEIMERCLKILE